jgi:hypothetical protein
MTENKTLQAEIVQLRDALELAVLAMTPVWPKEFLKEIIRQKLADDRAEHAVAAPSPAPRYDDVFFSGQEWLDDLAEGTVPEESGGASF